MAELPTFEPGNFLYFEDLNQIVRCLRDLQFETEKLRNDIEELKWESSCQELDFGPKVLYLGEGETSLQYPWYVRQKLRFEEPQELPQSQCEVEIVDGTANQSIEIRGGVLIPLYVGRTHLQVKVASQMSPQYFEVEVKQPDRVCESESDVVSD